MICPNCKKPYFFISKKDTRYLKCRRCSYIGNFKQPKYIDYHRKLYTKKPYTRNINTDPQMRIIIKTLNISSTDFILDIGCGVGDYTKEIYKKTRKVIGLDLNVNEAKKKYPGIKFLEHDCNKSLPYPDITADKIIAINLIEHLVDFNAFLSDCKRLLKNNGKIVLVTANLDFILHDYFFDKTHLHEWNLSEFINIVEKYFHINMVKKSSSMFKYYPLNMFMTKFLKPDLIFIGTKKNSK